MSDLPLSRRRHYYRRRLGVLDLLPAVAVGIGVGLVAFYMTRLMLEKTPLVAPPPGAPATRRKRTVPARS
ncbi:MAG TPA: hypothetical protein VEA99_08430 [Gemmatimonadaceae bacterium]|nr:hypothetical protein [Gemmatimonadaceae bacterium]